MILNVKNGERIDGKGERGEGRARRGEKKEGNGKRRKEILQRQQYVGRCLSRAVRKTNHKHIKGEEKIEGKGERREESKEMRMEGGERKMLSRKQYVGRCFGRAVTTV
jgi:hypothetical protein